VNKGTRVRIKDVPSTQSLDHIVAPGREGMVSSVHTNGVICVVMDKQEQYGSWAFGESELELV
jgi:hypothetical protein